MLKSPPFRFVPCGFKLNLDLKILSAISRPTSSFFTPCPLNFHGRVDFAISKVTAILTLRFQRNSKKPTNHHSLLNYRHMQYFKMIYSILQTLRERRNVEISFLLSLFSFFLCVTFHPRRMSKFLEPLCWSYLFW